MFTEKCEVTCADKNFTNADAVATFIGGLIQTGGTNIKITFVSCDATALTSKVRLNYY